MERQSSIAELLAEGMAHHASGDLTQAAQAYARAIAVEPDQHDPWRLLGIVALQAGDSGSARNCLQRAIALAADDVDAHAALGNLDELEHRLDDARSSYAAACALRATPAAVTGLARVSLRLGRPLDAIAVAEAAASHGMSDPGLLRTLGAARLARREYAEALDASRSAIRLQPHPDAWSNASVAHVHVGQIGEAIDAAIAALALDPAHAQAANNLGIALKANGDLRGAVAAFERAIELGWDDAHANLGTTRLLLGDYRGGWPEYGWISAERRSNSVAAALPMWDGRASLGKRLLIWPEQGVGDTIQMARFARQARARVQSVTFGCPPGTLDVFRTLDGVDACVDACVDSTTLASTDRFDMWIPTLRLPLALSAEPETLPCAPYLTADPARIDRFKPSFNASGKRRIGVVWSGNPQFIWNDIRSIPPELLAPLAAVHDVAWFALQQGEARHQAALTQLPLRPLDAEIADYADTAAVIAQLDLVITVDTSVAHLAGALGTPVWVLLSNQPDWRWGRAGDATPWYPTARLFRRLHDGRWEPVIAAIASALRTFAA